MDLLTKMILVKRIFVYILCLYLQSNPARSKIIACYIFDTEFGTM